MRRSPSRACSCRHHARGDHRLDGRCARARHGPACGRLRAHAPWPGQRARAPLVRASRAQPRGRAHGAQGHRRCTARRGVHDHGGRPRAAAAVGQVGARDRPPRMRWRPTSTTRSGWRRPRRRGRCSSGSPRTGWRLPGPCRSPRGGPAGRPAAVRPEPSALRAAAGVLSRSERPLAVAGAEVFRAGPGGVEAVSALAAAVGAPVMVEDRRTIERAEPAGIDGYAGVLDGRSAVVRERDAVLLAGARAPIRFEHTAPPVLPPGVPVVHLCEDAHELTSARRRRMRCRARRASSCAQLLAALDGAAATARSAPAPWTAHRARRPGRRDRRPTRRPARSPIRVPRADAPALRGPGRRAPGSSTTA